jgi:hypothetical protein
MTDDEIIEIADSLNLYDEPMHLIIRFARAIAAAEREACAKVCEKRVRRGAGYGGAWEGYGPMEGYMDGKECAAAIRARGESRE